MRPRIRLSVILSSLATALFAATPANADEAKIWTVRVGLGPKMGPQYPGADAIAFAPYILLGIRHTGDQLRSGGPGNSPGVAIFDRGGFKFGPIINLSPKRHAKDVGAPFERVDRALEVGLSAQYYILPALRVRVEGRRALWEYNGWVGNVSADYIIRDRDTYVITIGPRLRFGDDKYQRTYFGVTPEEAAASGLPAFKPDGGAVGAGIATGLVYQFSYHWGMRAAARYERLIGNPADSPIVLDRGSRDQYRAGIALTYTLDVGKIF